MPVIMKPWLVVEALKNEEAVKTSTVHKSNLVRSAGFQISPEITQRLCSYLRAGGEDRYTVVRWFSSS